MSRTLIASTPLTPVETDVLVRSPLQTQASFLIAERIFLLSNDTWIMDVMKGLLVNPLGVSVCVSMCARAHTASLNQGLVWILAFS